MVISIIMYCGHKLNIKTEEQLVKEELKEEPGLCLQQQQQQQQQQQL